MDGKTLLNEMFKQKGSFSGAVGTTYDVQVEAEPIDLSLGDLNPFKSRRKPVYPIMKTYPGGMEYVVNSISYLGKPKRIESDLSFDAFELIVKVGVFPFVKKKIERRASTFSIKMHVFPGTVYPFMAKVMSPDFKYTLTAAAIRTMLMFQAPEISGIYLKPVQDSDPVFQAVLDALIDHSVSTHMDSSNHGHAAKAAMTQNNQLKFAEAISGDADVSAVQRKVIMSTMGVTTSSSDSDEEWRRDIDYILSMFVERGFEGNVQVMKRTGKGPELTDVSIGVDQKKKEMTVMKNAAAVKTFTFEKKNDLIKFLEDHITTVMKLKLIDIVFRTFG